MHGGAALAGASPAPAASLAGRRWRRRAAHGRERPVPLVPLGCSHYDHYGSYGCYGHADYYAHWMAGQFSSAPTATTTSVHDTKPITTKPTTPRPPPDHGHSLHVHLATSTPAPSTTTTTTDHSGHYDHGFAGFVLYGLTATLTTTATTTTAVHHCRFGDHRGHHDTAIARMTTTTNMATMATPTTTSTPTTTPATITTTTTCVCVCVCVCLFDYCEHHNQHGHDHQGHLSHGHSVHDHHGHRGHHGRYDHSDHDHYDHHDHVHSEHDHYDYYDHHGHFDHHDPYGRLGCCVHLRAGHVHYGHSGHYDHYGHDHCYRDRCDNTATTAASTTAVRAPDPGSWHCNHNEHGHVYHDHYVHYDPHHYDVDRVCCGYHGPPPSTSPRPLRSPQSRDRLARTHRLPVGRPSSCAGTAPRALLHCFAGARVPPALLRCRLTPSRSAPPSFSSAFAASPAARRWRRRAAQGRAQLVPLSPLLRSIRPL